MKKHPRNPIITPAMVKPSHNDLRVLGALNPGAIEHNGEVFLLLRIAEGAKSDEEKVRVPVWEMDGEGTGRIGIKEWARNDPELRLKDTRGVVHQGREYVSTLSHLRLARSRNGVDFEIDDVPFIAPSSPSEEYGVEDARIVGIGDECYINYTAVSRDSYGTSLAKTRNFKNIERIGMIFTVPNKDVCIFPERIGGYYYALHRPYNHDFGKSSIWLARSPDLLHWGDHRCLIRPGDNPWETEKIGGGAPPIKTEKGWLEIYHGKTMRDGKDFYSLMVLLLDSDDPSKIIYRGTEPIIMPEESYEREGFVPNVVFLNGMIERGELLHLYYSVCDEAVCLATCEIDELLQ